MVPTRDDARLLAGFAPLLAGVIAPISTLLDIPALSESWMMNNGQAVSDDPANLALSSVELAFNVIANGLLLLRFSTSKNKRRWGIIAASIICWMVKLIIGLVNVIIFGIFTVRHGYTFGEGYWCAVLSVIISGFIVATLIYHVAFSFTKPSQTLPPDTKQLQIRVTGRHFMIQNTLFIATIGITALVMARIEHWTYLDGIYFAVETFLTIGFGDFVPTKTSTRILLFPFALLGIAQLGSLLQMLVSFFASRYQEHSPTRNAYYEKLQRKEAEANNEVPGANLVREIKNLTRLHKKTKMGRIKVDLYLNLIGFTLFWVLGALIFSRIESWTYGDGLYFCYVFFFAMGYGDLEPITPAGRVVFIVYSLLAVPVMASFAIGIITQSIRAISARLLAKERAKAGLTADFGAVDLDKYESLDNTQEGSAQTNERDTRTEESLVMRWLVPHTHFVEEGHKALNERLKERGAEYDDKDSADSRKHKDSIMMEYVLELAIELERHARRLLVAHMTDGSNGQVLLKADRIVQHRNMRSLAKELTVQDGETEYIKGRAGDLMQKFLEPESQLWAYSHKMGDQETLDEIRKYRESFASLLAAGSRSLELEGPEQYLFERRLYTKLEGTDNADGTL